MRLPQYASEFWLWL